MLVWFLDSSGGGVRMSSQSQDKMKTDILVLKIFPWFTFLTVGACLILINAAVIISEVELYKRALVFIVGNFACLMAIWRAIELKKTSERLQELLK